MDFEELLAFFKFLEDEAIDSVIVERTDNARVYSVKVGKVLKRYALTEQIQTTDLLESENNKE